MDEKKNNYIDQEKIEYILKEMPSAENIYLVTELFRALGDETRTRILSVLAEGEICVCHISKILNMTKSAISHQLKVLKMVRLVKSRKSGKEVYYSLDDEHIFKIYKAAIEHVSE